MQFSKDGITFGFESNSDFAKNIDRIAKAIGVAKGSFIYCRDHKDAPINKLPYGTKYGR